MKDLETIKKEILGNATLEQLEELGELNIDHIDDDLDLFIQALEEITGKEYTIKQFIGYSAIVEY